MNSTYEQWTKPVLEIVLFDSDDVIRTSGNTGTVQQGESGFGDLANWNDLFG